MNAIIKHNGKFNYPENRFFNPSISYKEYLFESEISRGKDNVVYDSFRKGLIMLGFDKKNFGTTKWNPLGDFIKPGNSVVVKPNLVKEPGLVKKDFEYLITHTSVLRTLIDYIIIALKDIGSIYIMDGPQTDSNFELILKQTKLMELLDFYKNRTKINIKIIDLRKEEWKTINGIVVEKKKKEGDPKGYIKFELNENSEFCEINNERRKYYGASFDIRETNSHHHDNIHEYLISKTLIDSDVIITVPKLKTHKKAGITCCLKNLVGINGDKNWLPHFSIGAPDKNGDQFPNNKLKNRFEEKALVILKNIFNKLSPRIIKRITSIKKIGEKIFGRTEDVIRSGNWYGNDTVWRMILDLNKIALYGDKNGRLSNKRRKIFCVVDAFVSGEGNGPLNPIKKETGLLIIGANPLEVDCICAKLVGYDFKKIPMLREAFNINDYKITKNKYNEIFCLSNLNEYNKKLIDINKDELLFFKPHFGWENHIEIK